MIVGNKNTAAGQGRFLQMGRRSAFSLFLGLLLVLLLGSLAWASPKSALSEASVPLEAKASNPKLVYEITVEGEITGSLEAYVKRAYALAEKDQAAYMVLNLDTLGGYIDTAVTIKQVIMSSPVKTICYVNDKAISAGALIALACQEIAMSPGAAMGAAEARQGGEPTDEKFTSYWSAELAATAEANGRNGKIAAAMADQSIVIPGVIEAGKLLTLTSAQAISLEMVDKEVANRQLLLESYGFEDAVIIQVNEDFQEQLSSFLTNPMVAPLLLAIGIGALVLEVLFAGIGIAGFVGVCSLVLYFTGGLLAGYASWLAIAFGIVGIILLVLEIFVIPGFGIAGGLGIAALLGAIISVAPSFAVAVGQITFAIVVVVILITISLKMGKTRRVWNKLILQDKTSTASGYVSQPLNINDYLGKAGVAMTDLRPAGAAKIGDSRVDVVTEGNFITAGKDVFVIKVDGSSVIVREGIQTNLSKVVEE